MLGKKAASTGRKGLANTRNLNCPFGCSTTHIPELLKQILFEMSMIASLVFSDREVVHVSQSAPLVVKESYVEILLD